MRGEISSALLQIAIMDEVESRDRGDRETAVLVPWQHPTATPRTSTSTTVSGTVSLSKAIGVKWSNSLASREITPMTKKISPPKSKSETHS